MSETTSPPSKEALDFSREAIERIDDPFARLRVIMKRLLDPGGCPWDREQTHESLKQYMIEEAYEVCEAIDKGDDQEFCEELGDVGLQVVFHAEMAERTGRFNIEDVYSAICKKLLDRHPHVFGEVDAADSEAVLRNWEQIKKEEKQRKAAERGSEPMSILDGVPVSLPALQKSLRLQQKAAKIGFDWDQIGDVMAKVREEVDEFEETISGKDKTRMQEELGDLLFSLVNVARHLDLVPEEALGEACTKFTNRFHAVERGAEESGRELRDMSLEEMDALWDQAKKEAAGK